MKGKLLNRKFVILERVGKHPELWTVDTRNANKLAKTLSNKDVDSVAWVADRTNVLYKGGERRI